MLVDPELDQMLDGQRTEFDEARRRELGRDPALLLTTLALNGVGGRYRPGAWPYWRNRKQQPWFGETFLLVNEWLDSSHATYQGRPF
jgi:hypothetical protein